MFKIVQIKNLKLLRGFRLCPIFCDASRMCILYTGNFVCCVSIHSCLQRIRWVYFHSSSSWESFSEMFLFFFIKPLKNSYIFYIYIYAKMLNVEYVYLIPCRVETKTKKLKINIWTKVVFFFLFFNSYCWD